MGFHILEAFAVLDLGSIRVADHVIMEHDAAESSELSAAGLMEVLRALFGCFCAGLLIVCPAARRRKASVLPVAMRVKYCRHFCLGALRAIEVARDIEPRMAGEKHLLDGVRLSFDLAMHD